MTDSPSVVTKDFLAGLLFMAVGIGTAFIATSYRVGTAAQMGPGYFPVLLGALLVLCGAVLAGRAFFDPASSEPLPLMKIRPLVLVLLGVVAFGILIRSFGLVVAIVGLVLISRFAVREGSVLEAIMMLIVLTLMPLGIFVYGLGIPLRVWPF